MLEDKLPTRDNIFNIISTWLEHHPENLGYECVVDLLDGTSKPIDGDCRRNAYNKRSFHPLQEVVNNASVPQHSRNTMSASPSKRGGKQTKGAISSIDGSIDNGRDLQETFPIAAPSNQRSDPPLRPRRLRTEHAKGTRDTTSGSLEPTLTPSTTSPDHINLEASHAKPRAQLIVNNWTEPAITMRDNQSSLSRYDTSPTRSTTDTSITSRSTRTRSPVKRVGDFHLSSMPSVIREFGDPKFPVPDAAKSLYLDLLRIDTLKRVVPTVIEEEIIPYLRDMGYDRPPFTEEVCSHLSDVASQKLIWHKVLEVHEAARDCSSQGDPESAWNAEVHSRILRMALGPGRSQRQVFYRDVSSANIGDISLLPVIGTGTSQTVMSGKMVDYAMIIEPSAVLESRIRRTLMEENSRSINQTEAENVRFQPIAVSMETKREGVGGDDADVQTLMWIIAQYKRLQQLKMSPMPVLPHIIVQGHEWKLRIAEMKSDGQIVVLRHVRLGQTTDILGIYQIMSALRRLAQWIDEDYRPLLEGILLPPL